MKSKLVIDTKTEVLADLESGMPSPLIEGRKKDPGIKGPGCMLASLKKISFFSNLETHERAIYKKFMKLKDQIESNYLDSLDILNDICSALKINPKGLITNHIFYKNHQKKYELNHVPEQRLFDLFDKKLKIQILYGAVIRHSHHIFNVKPIEWMPHEGPKKLMACLRKNGAILMVGKFGGCFHQWKLVRCENDDLKGREVFACDKDAYRGNQIPWTHTIVIDQMKEIAGQYFLYFRDPYYESYPGCIEKIIKISYEDFKASLCDLEGKKNPNEKEPCFGLQSNPLPAKNEHNEYPVARIALNWTLTSIACVLFTLLNNNDDEPTLFNTLNL